MALNYQTLSDMNPKGLSAPKPTIEKWYSTPLKTVYELNKNSLTGLPSGPSQGPKHSIRVTKHALSKKAKTMLIVAIVIVLLLVLFFVYKDFFVAKKTPTFYYF